MLMARNAIAPRVRPRKSAPCVPFQTLDLARSAYIHQLLPRIGLFVRRRHSVLCCFVSRQFLLSKVKLDVRIYC